MSVDREPKKGNKPLLAILGLIGVTLLCGPYINNVLGDKPPAIPTIPGVTTTINMGLCQGGQGMFSTDSTGRNVHLQVRRADGNIDSPVVNSLEDAQRACRLTPTPNPQQIPQATFTPAPQPEVRQESSEEVVQGTYKFPICGTYEGGTIVALFKTSDGTLFMDIPHDNPRIIPNMTLQSAQEQCPQSEPVLIK